MATKQATIEEQAAFLKRQMDIPVDGILFNAIPENADELPMMGNILFSDFVQFIIQKAGAMNDERRVLEAANEVVTSLDPQVNLKLHREARKAGIKLLGDAANWNKDYRRYKLNCGHERDIQTPHVRFGKFHCSECYAIERDRRLNEVGFEYVAHSKGNYHIIRHSACGNEFDYLLGSVTLGGYTPVCQRCLKVSRQEALAGVGYEYVKPSKGNYHTIRHKECGSEFDYNLGHVTSGGKTPVCQHCLTESRQQTLADIGYEYVKHSKWKHHVIRHKECGSEFAYLLGSVTLGGKTPTCPSCGGSHFNRDTNIYLKVYRKGRKSILKLGLANDVDKRELVINPLAGVTLQQEYIFKAGVKLDGLKLEKSLHKVFKTQVLNPTEAKQFITSGFTECYPSDCFNVIYRTLEDKLGAPELMVQGEQLLLLAA